MNTAPFSYSISQNFNQIANKRYIESVFNSNKISQTDLLNKFQNLYFDYLIALKKGDLSLVADRLEDNFRRQSEFFLDLTDSIDLVKNDKFEGPIKQMIFENVLVKGVYANRDLNDSSKNYKYYNREEQHGIRYFVHK